MGTKASITELDGKVSYETLEESLGVQEKALQVHTILSMYVSVCIYNHAYDGGMYVNVCMHNHV